MIVFGVPGPTGITVSTAGLRSSFPGILLCLVVGHCGGVPTPKKDVNIFLGDIIVSTGISDYGYAHQTQDSAKEDYRLPTFTLQCFLQLLRSHEIQDDMEGAGAGKSVPTLVVKSVSGYTDSHKNKAW